MATIFPGSASVGQIFDGYEFNGTAWDIVGIDLTADYPEIIDGKISASVIPSTFATTSYVNQQVGNINLSPYLTQSSASTTYITQASASTTYATKTELNNIDLSSASAAAVAAIVDSAPSTLNTLNELAAALGDDANYASTITTALGNKLDTSTASSTYQPLNGALSTLSSTFGNITIQSGIVNFANYGMGMLSWSLDTNTYLTEISASTTYAPIVPAVQTGFRNAIINGGMDIWQRGTSFSGNSVYTADRWVSTTDTTTTWTRQNFTPGNPITGYEPTYFFRSVVSGGAYSIIEQRIEDVRTLAGQTVTLSFFAKANATKNLWVRLDQNFGTSGSTTVSYTSLDVKSISSTWNRYTYTFAVPSITGKTVGANSYLSVQFWFTGGGSGTQTGTFDLWGVQLENGTIATPFEQRPIGTEISLCQRYFCKSFPIDVTPANGLGTGPGSGNQLTIFSTTVGNNYANFQRFPVPMRRAPDMVAFNAENGNAGTWSIYSSSGALNSSFATTGAFSPHHTGFLLSYGGVSTITVANGAWTASAEL